MNSELPDNCDDDIVEMQITHMIPFVEGGSCMGMVQLYIIGCLTFLFNDD